MGFHKGDQMFRSMLCLLFLALSLAYAANPYEVSRFQDENGKTIVEHTIPGIPEALRNPGPSVTPGRSAVILSDVPKLNWVYGCTATSAAMMAGYYDRNGYPNMYAGPTNGGLFPLTNAAWGYGECSLSATHQGYDGLGVWGHVDRFWTGYGNSGDDPYGTANPTGTYANCTADYIGTNQDYWNNSDGSSTIFTYNDGSVLSNYSGHETATPRKRDAIRGFRLFMESRGYQITTNYNQLIQGYNGNSQGYTLAQFQQSIDNGIPVMIHIQGHTMVGVGYESTSSLIYIHDTWDHNLHTMTWGGSYSDALHWSVSVIELVPSALVSNITWNPASMSKSLESDDLTTQNLIIGNTGTGALDYQASVSGGGIWLSINGGSSVSGTINSGAANHTLSVGFDASGLSAGTYNSDITIESNSATNSLVTIPVSLTVLAPLGIPQEPEIELLANGTSARISWNAVSGSPTGYKLYFCPLPDFSSGVSLLATTAASRLYYVDNAAGSRAKGFYRVVAYR